MHGFTHFSHKVLLERECDRRLARAGQPGEPNRAAPEGVLVSTTEYLASLLSGNPEVQN